MNEKSLAEEIHSTFRCYVKNEAGENISDASVGEIEAIITKHLPSGDVGMLKLIAESLPCNCGHYGHFSYCARGKALALAALASVPANPPQVDTPLEGIAANMRREAVYKCNLSSIEAMQEQLLSWANAISAHARKSQPKEGVNQRLLKAAAALLAETGKYDLNYITGDDGACGAAESQLMKAVLATESAAVPSMEDELAETLRAIVNGALHPDKAVRRVMVDLEPIRAVLARFDARKEGGK